jgi:hypothetical protein
VGLGPCLREFSECFDQRQLRRAFLGSYQRAKLRLGRRLSAFVAVDVEDNFCFSELKRKKRALSL